VKNVGLSIEMMRALAYLRQGCLLVRLPGGTWAPYPSRPEKGFSTLTVKSLLRRELAEVEDWRVDRDTKAFAVAVRLRPDYRTQSPRLDTPHPLPSPPPTAYRPPPTE